MTRAVLAGVLTLGALGMTGCGDDDEPAVDATDEQGAGQPSDVDPEELAAAGVLEAGDLPDGAEEQDDPGELASVSGCAPVEAFPAVGEGVVAEAASPSFGGSMSGSSPRVSVDVANTVFVYGSADVASEAFGAFDQSGFEECFAATLEADLEGEENLDGTRDFGDVDAVDFDEDDIDVGDEGIRLEAAFEEGVLGGYDNSRVVDLVAVRQGPVLLVFTFAYSGQSFEDVDVDDMEEDTITSVLDRMAS